MNTSARWSALAILGGLFLAGCGQSGGNRNAAGVNGPIVDTAGRRVSTAGFIAPAPRTGVFEICKLGSAADFDVVIVVNTDGLPPSTITKTIHLGDGECAVAHTETDGRPADVVTITERAASGTQLDYIEIYNIDEFGTITTHTDPGPTITGQIRTGKSGCVAVFHNSIVKDTSGRMTGGGFQVQVDGVRISRGLTLHCDITLSNNLEINWAGGNNWHITRPLLSADCIDDPNYDPGHPRAPFDTFIGEASGSLNGKEGSICRFKFIDDGEPGTTDEAHIRIWAPGANPNTDAPALTVSGQLDGGNLQAHYDQPHR